MQPRLTGAAAIAAALLLAAAPAAAQSDRDHVWVVDQAGTVTPLYGCWQLAAASNPLADSTIGNIVVFGATPLPNEYRDDGIVRDPDGHLWTLVGLKFPGEDWYVVAERLDLQTDPQRWYSLALINPDGTHRTDYPTTAAQFAGTAPDANLESYDRISCLAVPQ